MDFAENQKEKKGGEDSDSDSLSVGDKLSFKDNLEAETDNRNVTPHALREITGESPQDYLAELSTSGSVVLVGLRVTTLT